jgi:hypothetical protein
VLHRNPVAQVLAPVFVSSGEIHVLYPPAVVVVSFVKVASVASLVYLLLLLLLR